MNTIYFKNRPKITATAVIIGPKEGEGILGKYADKVLKDDMFEESTFEKAECKMLSWTIRQTIENAKKPHGEVGAILSGDLLNQIISSNFAARDFAIPYIGLYGACSTMSEAFGIGAALIDGGYLKNAVAATGSHFSSAERQYRFPLELGSTRPPQSQWTVTAAGGAFLSSDGDGPSITGATFGKVIDYGVTDANNMGAAMAPAAMDTVFTHFKDTGLSGEDYDLILTGDLGEFGSRCFKYLMWQKGYDLENIHQDCGQLVYNAKSREFQGGSGAGCSAAVFSSYIYDKLKSGSFKKMLFVATGALLSTVSTQQGESIPCIAHAVSIEA